MAVLAKPLTISQFFICVFIFSRFPRFKSQKQPIAHVFLTRILRCSRISRLILENESTRASRKKRSRIQIDRLVTAPKPTLKCSDTHCTHHIPANTLFTVVFVQYACSHNRTQIHKRLYFASRSRTYIGNVCKVFSRVTLCCSTHGRLFWSRIHFCPAKIVEYYLLDHKSHTLSIFTPTKFALGESLFNHWISRSGKERGKGITTTKR